MDEKEGGRKGFQLSDHEHCSSSGMSVPLLVCLAMCVSAQGVLIDISMAIPMSIGKLRGRGRDT